VDGNDVGCVGGGKKTFNKGMVVERQKMWEKGYTENNQNTNKIINQKKPFGGVREVGPGRGRGGGESRCWFIFPMKNYKGNC